jgi:hypothetical protein
MCHEMQRLQCIRNQPAWQPASSVSSITAVVTASNGTDTSSSGTTVVAEAAAAEAMCRCAHDTSQPYHIPTGTHAAGEILAVLVCRWLLTSAPCRSPAPDTSPRRPIAHVLPWRWWPWAHTRERSKPRRGVLTSTAPNEHTDDRTQLQGWSSLPTSAKDREWPVPPPYVSGDRRQLTAGTCLHDAQVLRSRASKKRSEA